MSDAWGQQVPQQGWPQQPPAQGFPPPQQDPWGGQQAAPAGPPAPTVAELLGGGSGGPWGPSFKFVYDEAQGVGNGVLGTIVAAKPKPKTDPGSTIQKVDAKGRPRWEIAVTLQTTLRRWQGVARQPTRDVNGQDVPIPPEEDTGLRNVYLDFKSRDAVAEAMKAAGIDLGQGIPTGAVLGLQVTGVEQNPKGRDPIKVYRAIFHPEGQVPPNIQQLLAAPPAPALQQPVAPPQGPPPGYTPPQQPIAQPYPQQPPQGYPAQPAAYPQQPPQGYPAQPAAYPQPPQGPPPGFAPGTPGQDQPPF